MAPREKGEEYRKLVVSFWTDPDIKRRLTNDEKLLLIYLFSNPHSNAIGFYYLPLQFIAAETGMDPEWIEDAIAGMLRPFVSYDSHTEEVWVHNMARIQIAEDLSAGDKRRINVERALRGRHSKRLLRSFLEHYREWALDVEMPHDDEAPEADEAPSKPHTKPKQVITEQNKAEQSTAEQNNKPRRKRVVSKPKVTPEMQSVADEYLLCHPRRKVIDAADWKAIQSAMEAGWKADDLRGAIRGNASDPWHVEHRKHELSYVLRNADNIQKFLDLSTATSEDLSFLLRHSPGGDE